MMISIVVGLKMLATNTDFKLNVLMSKYSTVQSFVAQSTNSFHTVDLLFILPNTEGVIYASIKII
jgi:hypothetical protein